jgi:Acetyltransferase (GNAT) domain
VRRWTAFGRFPQTRRVVPDGDVPLLTERLVLRRFRSDVRLHDNLRQAELGFTLAPAHQGQGYATEAVTSGGRRAGSRTRAPRTATG